MLRAVCMLMCAAKSSTISLCLASLLPALQRPVSLPHICSTLERHHLQDKLQLYLDRLLILQQRLRRHPLFNKPALSGMGGSHQDYCEVSQALNQWDCRCCQMGLTHCYSTVPGAVFSRSCAMSRCVSLRFKPCLLKADCWQALH